MNHIKQKLKEELKIPIQLINEYEDDQTSSQANSENIPDIIIGISIGNDARLSNEPGFDHYVNYMVSEFGRLYRYDIIASNISIHENAWTIEVLSVCFKRLFDSYPNIHTSWAEHTSQSSKTRMLSAQENSRHAHKIDYLVYWTDNEKSNWEMVAGEFCGKPFEPDRRKYRKDLFKLFRIMKDMLDCLIAQIISCSNGKINKEIYDLICQIKTFGIISYETQIELFVLSRPFPSIHTVTRWCTLPLPYKKSDHEALLPIIESLWGLLQREVFNQIKAFIKIIRLSEENSDSSYCQRLYNCHAITIGSPRSSHS